MNVFSNKIASPKSMQCTSGLCLLRQISSSNFNNNITLSKFMTSILGVSAFHQKFIKRGLAMYVLRQISSIDFGVTVISPKIKNRWKTKKETIKMKRLDPTQSSFLTICQRVSKSHFVNSNSNWVQTKTFSWRSAAFFCSFFDRNEIGKFKSVLRR